MSERTGYKREEVEFTGKRIRHHSTLSFDDVLARLRARVGETTLDNVVGCQEPARSLKGKSNSTLATAAL